jgi:hypothetical protein
VYIDQGRQFLPPPLISHAERALKLMSSSREASRELPLPRSALTERIWKKPIEWPHLALASDWSPWALVLPEDSAMPMA